MASDADNLTNIVVEATVPPDCVSVRVFAYPEPLVRLISKPDGGVITILFVKQPPLTVNDCGVDAVPTGVLNAVNVPVFVIPPATTVPVTATFKLALGVLDVAKAIFPEYVPAADPVANLTKTWVGEPLPPLSIESGVPAGVQLVPPLLLTS